MAELKRGGGGGGGGGGERLHLDLMIFFVD